MKFSIFEDDNSLGNAADYGSPYLRDVSLQIEGTFQNPISGDYNNANGIKNLLNNKGWIVEQVNNASTSWVPQINGFIYNLFCVVGTNYTDRQIQDQVRRDLSGFFNVTAVSTLSAPWTPNNAAPANQGGNTRPPAGFSTTPPANYGNSLPPASGGAAAGSGIGFFDSFAQGLGIGVPTATILLIGGVVLLMRK